MLKLSKRQKSKQRDVITLHDDLYDVWLIQLNTSTNEYRNMTTRGLERVEGGGGVVPGKEEKWYLFRRLTSLQ